MSFTRMFFLLLASALISCEHINNIKSAVSKKVVAENSTQHRLKKKKVRKKDGLVVNRRKDGSLLSELNLKDGKLHGMAKDYYPNGSLHAQFLYENGVLQGERKWYHENGKIYKITPFTNGEIDGVEKTFHANGKIMAEVPYKANYPGTGLKEYTQDGKVSKKQPSIIIETIDNIARTNNYTIKIRLSDNSKKVQYYLGDLTDGKYMNDKVIRVVTEGGIGTITYNVLPGHYFMEKLNIVAKQTTSKGNPYIVQKKFNLAIENKGI